MASSVLWLLEEHKFNTYHERCTFISNLLTPIKTGDVFTKTETLQDLHIEFILHNFSAFQRKKNSIIRMQHTKFFSNKDKFQNKFDSQAKKGNISNTGSRFISATNSRTWWQQISHICPKNRSSRPGM